MTLCFVIVRRPKLNSIDAQMGYLLRSSRYRDTEWREWKTHRVAARELYDHRNDPGENYNIAGRAENDKLMLGFSKRILASFSSLGRKAPSGK